jgi:hypothetical protein
MSLLFNPAPKDTKIIMGVLWHAVGKSLATVAMEASFMDRILITLVVFQDGTKGTHVNLPVHQLSKFMQ